MAIVNSKSNGVSSEVVPYFVQDKLTKMAKDVRYELGTSNPDAALNKFFHSMDEGLWLAKYRIFGLAGDKWGIDQKLAIAESYLVTQILLAGAEYLISQNPGLKLNEDVFIKAGFISFGPRAEAILKQKPLLADRHLELASSMLENAYVHFRKAKNKQADAPYQDHMRLVWFLQHISDGKFQLNRPEHNYPALGLAYPVTGSRQEAFLKLSQILEKSQSLKSFKEKSRNTNLDRYLLSYLDHMSRHGVGQGDHLQALKPLMEAVHGPLIPGTTRQLLIGRGLLSEGEEKYLADRMAEGSLEDIKKSWNELERERVKPYFDAARLRVMARMEKAENVADGNTNHARGPGYVQPADDTFVSDVIILLGSQEPNDAEFSVSILVQIVNNRNGSANDNLKNFIKVPPMVFAAILGQEFLTRNHELHPVRALVLSVVRRINSAFTYNMIRARIKSQIQTSEQQGGLFHRIPGIVGHLESPINIGDPGLKPFRNKREELKVYGHSYRRSQSPGRGKSRHRRPESHSLFSRNKIQIRR